MSDKLDVVGIGNAMVDAIMKENKINLKKEEDLKQLIAFFN